jgi:hypothetical protein
VSDKAQQPGPGRSTSEAAFNEVRKQIAERNSAAHKAAREQQGPHARLKAENRRLANSR